MTFTGAPSTACQRCKTRKLKCGGERPQCRKCLAIGKPCPGPRDAVDVIFRQARNPSKPRTQPKMKARRDSESTAPSTLAKPVESQHEAFHEANEATHPCQALQLSYTDRGIALLFKIMEDVGQIFPCQGVGPYMRHVAELYQNSEPQSLLAQMTDATGMVILAQHHRSPSLETSAFIKYATSIPKLRASISDAASAKSNETLLSTLLLSLCECYSGISSSTVRYRDHLDGAITLLRLRGTTQFETAASLELFRDVRTQMVINYAHRRQPLPPFQDDRGWHSEPGVCTDPLTELTRTLLDLPGLLAATDRLANKESLTAALSIKARADALDKLMMEWYSGLPQQWLPVHATFSPLEQHKLAYDDYCLTGAEGYSSVYAAYTINTYRIFRAFVQEVRLQSLAVMKIASVTNLLETQSRIVIQDMADGICASVPYHFGWLDSEDMLGPNISPTSAGFYLQYALLNTSRLAGLSSSQKSWIRARLKDTTEMEEDITSALLLAKTSAKMLEFVNKQNPETSAQLR